MHFKNVKGILSSTNGMNLYRGCLHGCIYCDSRMKLRQMPLNYWKIILKENVQNVCWLPDR